MALSKKNNEQISFDELEFEAEYSEVFTECFLLNYSKH